MRLVVLGSTGMLGSEVVRIASQWGIPTLPISRTGKLPFDAQTDSFEAFSRLLELTPDDFLVNAIGWIPQKASGTAIQDQRDATMLNDSLVQQISSIQADVGFRWLQIGTDCVFSGSKGGYSELDLPDADDLYGISKIAGEEHCSSAILIRSSIIGPDSKSQAGLYSWFKSAVRLGAVRGFTNHLWNGVTTTAFARLAIGLMRNDFGPTRQHWTPLDTVSKYQLLQFFADAMDISETSVQEFTAPQSVDRTLVSVAPGVNEQLWGIAGYDGVPTIHDLVAEMVSQERRLV